MFPQGTDLSDLCRAKHSSTFSAFYKSSKAQQSSYIANANAANAENQKAIYDDFKLKSQDNYGHVYEYSGDGANVEKITDLINNGQEGIELEWNKITYNAKIDSLNNEINDLLIQNDRLKDTINILQVKCGAIDRENNILRDNNKKYQENTKNLIKKINNK